MSPPRKQALRRKSREAAGASTEARTGPRGHRFAWVKWAAGLAALVTAAWFAWPPGTGADTDLGIPEHDLTGVEPRVAAAIEKAREGVRSAPLSPRAWGILGAVLDVHHIFDPAETAYLRAQELDPEEFRWPYNLACVGEVLAREPASILAHYARAEELRPDHAPLHCRRGDALVGFGRLDEARRSYARALEIDDGLARAHRGFGLALLQADELESAVLHLERAAELSPADATALNALARAYARTGDGDRARLAAEKAQGLRPFNHLPDSFRDELTALGVSGALCAARATSLLMAERYADALPDLEFVAEMNARDPYAHLRLGIARMHSSALDSAQVSFERALTLKEDLGAAHLELGRLLMSRGQLEGAVHHLERSAELEPDNPLTHSNLGNAYLLSNDTGALLSHYGRVAGRHELDVDALLNWSSALQSRGLLSEAVRRAREALALDRGKARSHIALGFLSQQLDDPDAALHHYRKAIELEPGQADARLNLGLLCEELGRLEEAGESLRELLRIAPSHPRRDLILARLSSIEERRRAADSSTPPDSP